MGLPIEALWSCYQNLLAERDRLNDENNALRAEVDRLKRGDWTPEEIHDICHNLHGKVDARAFADGCAAEQRKLYGCAPDADAAAEAIIRVGP